MLIMWTAPSRCYSVVQPGLDPVKGQPSLLRGANVLWWCRVVQPPPSIAERLNLDPRTENILAEAGYEQVYEIDEIITRMPTPSEISRLGISTGTPVAEHIRVGYSATNRPVRGHGFNSSG